MASNTITLTFAGNAKPLKKEIDKVGGFFNKLKGDAERTSGRMNLFGKGSGFFNKLAELPKLVGSAFTALPAMAQGPILAAGAAIAALLAAPIGAAITAAVLLAVGGGVLAAGISRAIKDPRVKAAWAPLGEQARGALDKLGSHFVAPLERAASSFQPVVDKLGPMADRLGAALAPVIDKLAPALAGMAEKILPAIERAAIASVPLFEKLAEKAPKIADAIVRFFDMVVEYGPTAEQFFGRLLDLTAFTVDAVAAWVRTLVQVYQAGEALFSLFRKAGTALGGVFDSLWSGFKTNINRIIDAWNRLEFRIGGGKVFGMDIPSVTLGTPNIPKFHTGGVMPGAPGSEGLALLQAGETVIPAGQGGSVNLVLTAGSGSDFEKLMAALITRLVRTGQLKLVRA